MSNIKDTIEAMLKPLYLTFDNGEVYVTDGHFVADHAAKFYAGKYPADPDESYKDNYDYEYNWLINDINELADHMQNKIDWKDLNVHHVGKKPYDYDYEYINCGIDDDVNLDELTDLS